MLRRFVLRVVLLLWLTIASGTFCRANQDFREAPPFYSEKLAAFLTPLDEVLKNPPKIAPNTNPDGIMLLDEEIRFFDSEGAEYRVRNHIYQAITEAGVPVIAEDTYSYRKTNQKIYLIQAQTILPDGRTISLAPSAAMLRSPQRQASDSMYNEVGELHLIFPSIKPGSITQAIVAVKTKEFRMPGEFSAIKALVAGFPIERLRYIIDAPKPLAERFKFTSLGAGIPTAKKEELANDRTRWTWEGKEIPPGPYETSGPPTYQSGPALFITTLPDWDALARWYYPLVEARSELSPALLEKVDHWTREAKDNTEVLDILYRKVAKEIRYVSLAFGTADLQPYDCNSVWQNQYGDCKDKSTLLRAMLRHKGIEASIVLLNTDHSGRMEKRSPSYAQFDHAILVAYPEAGKPIFCDPTIAYGRPGLLSPASSHRDALIISPQGAEWVHIPGQTAGVLTYDFDLKLAPSGELSGWMTEKRTDIYGAFQAANYVSLDQSDTKSRVDSLIQAFFKGAEVIDVETTPIESWNGEYTIRAYFMVPSPGESEGQSHHLAFPKAEHLFYDLGSEKKRKTPYLLWPDQTVINAQISLPDGLTPSDLPRPLNMKGEGLKIAAAWEHQGNVATARLALTLQNPLISPQEFPAFSNSHRALHAWLNRPLNLSSSGQLPAVENALTLDNFPMMATGQGQLDLVNKRFPVERDPALRKEALLKTIQYFPFDKTTQFLAKIWLIWMDEPKDPAAAQKAFRQQIKQAPADLPAERIAWAEYLLASSLIKSTPAEAKAIFHRLQKNRHLSDFRRSWALYQEALLIEDREEIINTLRSLEVLDDEASPGIFTLLVKNLILSNRTSELPSTIELILNRPEHDDILTRLANSAATLLPEEYAQQRNELLDLLANATESKDLSKGFFNALSQARQQATAGTASKNIQAQLKHHLEQHPEHRPSIDPSQIESKADLFAAIERTKDSHDSRIGFAYRLQLLTQLEPGSDYPERLWDAIRWADWKERQLEAPEPMLPVLLDLSELLPHSSDAYVEILFARARVLVRAKDFEGARKIHASILTDVDPARGFRTSALQQLALNLEALERYPEALEVYRQFESELHTTAAINATFRALLLNLELQQQEEAERLLALLQGRGVEALRKAESWWQIEKMLQLAEQPGGVRGYWKLASAWWPEWLKLREKLGLPSQEQQVTLPMLGDFATVYQHIEDAIAKKDQASFAATLQQVAAGARWQPYQASILLRALYDGPELIPAQPGEVMQFARALYTQLQSHGSSEAPSQAVSMVVLCLNHGHPEEAFQIVQKHFQDEEMKSHPTREPMARLWGLIAKEYKSEEIEPATKALEKSLLRESLSQRRISINVLADLYAKANRAADERKLLEQALEHPQIKAKREDHQAIHQRLTALVRSSTDAEARANLVKEWLKTYRPDWFDYAEPKSLEAPRLRDLQAIMNSRGSLTETEYLKTALLIASDASLPIEHWHNTLIYSVNELAAQATTQTQAREILESLLHREELSEAARTYLYLLNIEQAFKHRDREHLERLLKLPAYTGLSEDAQKKAAFYQQAIVIDETSPKAISEFVLKLMKGKVTAEQNAFIGDAFRILLEAGAFEQSEEIYAQLSSIELAPGNETDLIEGQMGLLKMQRHAKLWSPAVNAMRAIILKRFPDAPTTMPARYQELNNRRELTSLDEATATQTRLYLIKTRQANLNDFEFWTDLADKGDLHADNALMLELAEAALKHAEDDDMAAGIVVNLAIAIDLDNREIMERFQKLTAPFCDATHFPATHDFVASLAGAQAWRRGEAFDPEVAFAAIRAPQMQGFVQHTKLSFYLQTGDDAGLRRTLKAIPSTLLFTERLLPSSLRAFKRLGMADELALAERAATKTLYQLILSSWSSPDPSDWRLVYKLAREVDAPLPEAWVKNLLSKVGSERERDSIRCADASYRKDWSGLLSASTEAIPRAPTLYKLHWYQGEALYHLGRFQEAEGPLKIFAQSSKDEKEYPQCQKWLEEIAARR